MLFRSHGGSVVVGKEGYLYESQYLVSHAGKDYIGEKEIDARLERIRFVTERLNEKGIHLLIAFAPSKADFFSEYIPDFYKRDSLNPTNYDSYRSKLLSSDIPFIDFNSYFLSVKKSAPYPLFPKQGIHWSEYGVYLSADSILKYFNQKFGLNLNTMLCNHVDLSPELRSTDYDLGDLCNVLYVMHHYDMPYPSLQFQTDPAKSKPNMLVVGDSFYWNIYYSEIPKKIFNGANFWYYNHEVYCDSVPKKQVLDIAHFQNAVEQQKIILVLTTESNLNNLGFGFFEMAYDMLHTDSNILRRYEQEIKNDPEWLKLVSKKAAERNITLDEMIRSDARWMLEQETAKKK